jgi:hypothetical protein
MAARIALTDVSAWLSQDDQVLEQLVTQLPSLGSMASLRFDTRPSVASTLAHKLEQRP